MNYQQNLSFHISLGNVHTVLTSELVASNYSVRTPVSPVDIVFKDTNSHRVVYTRLYNLPPEKQFINTPFKMLYLQSGLRLDLNCIAAEKVRIYRLKVWRFLN